MTMAKKPMRTATGRGQDRAATMKALDNIGYAGGPKVMKLARETVGIQKAAKSAVKGQAALANRVALNTKPKQKPK
jgi:hypothetical protein